MKRVEGCLNTASPTRVVENAGRQRLDLGREHGKQAPASPYRRIPAMLWGGGYLPGAWWAGTYRTVARSGAGPMTYIDG